MSERLIGESIYLLSHGMGVVFVFLMLLVLATHLMSWLVNRLSPTPPEPVAEARDMEVDPLTLKIIQAALNRHRRR